MNNNEGIKNHNVEHRNTITVVLPTIMWNNPSHFFFGGGTTVVKIPTMVPPLLEQNLKGDYCYCRDFHDRNPPSIIYVGKNRPTMKPRIRAHYYYRINSKSFTTFYIVLSLKNMVSKRTTYHSLKKNLTQPIPFIFQLIF